MNREHLVPYLFAKRAVNLRTGKELTHQVSRHCDLEDPLTHRNGAVFGQGSLFPSHVNANHISQMTKDVREEWLLRGKKGKKSKISCKKEAGGAVRVSIDYCKYGVKRIGAFIRHNGVITIFPEITMGTNFIKKGDKKLKKQ